MLKKDTFRSKIDLENNPFAKVFPNMEAAKRYAKKVKQFGRTVFYHELHGDLVGDDLTLNLIVEEVFNLTLCNDPPSFNRGETHLVYLSIEDISGTDKLTANNIDILGLVLMERLLLENPSSHLKSLKSSPNIPNHAVETRTIFYLFECFRRLQKKKENKKELPKVICQMIDFVIQNVATALSQPEVYEKQDLSQQVSFKMTIWW